MFIEHVSAKYFETKTETPILLSLGKTQPLKRCHLKINKQSIIKKYLYKSINKMTSKIVSFLTFEQKMFILKI